MSGRITQTSPRRTARLAGLFELLEGLSSAGGQVLIPGRFIVAGNAAATASNLLAHQRLFWLGFALSVVAVAFHVVWLLLFQDLTRPVDRTISRLAAVVMIVGCALQALTALLYAAPLLVLNAGTSLSAFTVEQSRALAYLFLRLNSYSFDLYLVFFGLWCVLAGYLIFRSTFLPRVLGVLLAIDGLGWMLFLSPPLGRQLFPFIGAASGIAEIPLMFWLLVIGVNERRWREQADAAS